MATLLQRVPTPQSGDNAGSFGSRLLRMMFDPSGEEGEPKKPAEPAPASAAAPRPGEPRSPQPPGDVPSAVLFCESARDWLKPEAAAFKGMRVVRPQKWDHVQAMIDKFYDDEVFGSEHRLSQEIELGKLGSDQELWSATHQAVDRLLETPIEAGLPRVLAAQIRKDCEEICRAVGGLTSSKPNMLVKLELMRDNSCIRWHRDNYTARAIVSYNVSGTEYIHDDFVDLWELENCGANACVVKDRKHVCFAGVGDMMYMKGAQFPDPINGLSHRSPEPTLDENGNIMTRLLLKVDVP